MPVVSFYTLGCRLNQAETAMIAERFRAKGYGIVEHGQTADVAVIHTCSVTEHADARCRQEIRKVRRKNPDAIVCAVGCYAQAEPEAVAAIEAVSLVVGNDQKYNLADIVQSFWEGEAPAEPPQSSIREGEATAEPALSSRIANADSIRLTPTRAISVPKILVNRRLATDDFDYPMVGYYPHQTRANIKIQDGCDFCCAFCILPRIRGEARSRRLGEIVAEGHELARRGHRELVITGVNVGTYQYEEFTIADVAWRLSEIPGIERIRISSIEPSTVSDDLLAWMAESPKACRHLHLPLQSGDDETLSAMKRVYTTAEYARFVEKAKSLMPDLAIGTDIMAGFPGESDEHFENSRKFIAEMPFSYLHVFSYSDRPKTAANYYGDKCHPKVIRERSAILHGLAEQKKCAFYDSQIGRSEEVLFESVDADGLRKGFTRAYVRVGIDEDQASENEIKSVYIIHAAGDLCRGTTIPNQSSQQERHAQVCH